MPTIYLTENNFWHMSKVKKESNEPVDNETCHSGNRQGNYQTGILTITEVADTHFMPCYQ